MSLNIICFSGGKDSSAMLLKMLELNYKIDKIFFCDTGLEYPDLYNWIKTLEKYINRDITTLKPLTNFDYWFYGKFTKGKNKNQIRGFPYQLYPCYWTRESKVNVLNKNIGKNNNIYIGIAYDEIKRSKAKCYINKPNKYYFPLIDLKMKEIDCINYLNSLGLKHPLLNKFDRSGCWLCPKQNLKSLKNLYIYYPELFKKLKQYEKDSPHGFKINFKLSEFENKIKEEVI